MFFRFLLVFVILAAAAAPAHAGFFSKIGEAFQSLWQDEEKDEPAPPMEKKPEEKKEVIRAKKLEAPKQEEKNENPPYKVYASPPLRGSENVITGKAAAATPAWITPVEQGAIPPPPLITMQDQLDMPPVIIEGEDEPQATSLPQMFFPIFPFGATDNTSMQLLPLASSVPLDEDHADTSSAIIFIHDMQRNAAEGIAALMTLAGPQDTKPLILAPQFSLETDVRRFEQLLPDGGRTLARWSFEDPWTFGGLSHIDAKARGISSFAAIDLLLMFLGDHARFPALHAVTIVGHGAGADFVQRYAALGRVPEMLEENGIVTRFIVANPSSYMYMTAMRWNDKGAQLSQPALREKCPAYNDYPYGAQKQNEYGRRTSLQDMRLRYPERRILYLIGDSIRADNYLDRDCEAAIQGPERLDRARAFERFLSQTYGPNLDGKQLITRVAGVGYDPLAMFASPCAMAILFESGVCKPVAP